MILIFCSWLYVLWLSLAFGLALSGLNSGSVARASGSGAQEKTIFPILSGFVIISGLAGAWTLFSPIDIPTQVFFTTLGVGLTYRYRDGWRWYLCRILNKFQEIPGSAKIILALATAAALWAASEEIIHADTGIYHLQAIQWIKTYPVIPGLGNLFPRLAYNSHFFIVEALFSLVYNEKLVVLPLNGFFYLLFCTTVIDKIFLGLRERHAAEVWLYSVLFILFTDQYLPHLNSSSTDQVLGILVFYAFHLYRTTLDRNNRSGGAFLVGAIIFTALTYKLSSILLLALFPGVLLRIRPAGYLSLALMATLVICPFLYRNIVLSGYPLFPMPDLDIIHVDWKIPIEKVQREKDFIESFAKLGFVDTASRSMEEIIELQRSTDQWLLEWLASLGFRWQLILLLNMLNLVPFAYAIRRRDYTQIIVHLTIWINLLFWFHHAPAPRFAYGFLFFGSAGALSFFLTLKLELSGNNRLRWWLASGLALALYLSTLRRSDTESNHSLEWARIVLPATYPPAITEEFQALDLLLQVPRAGQKCHNHPVPCTPYPDSLLEMRGKDLREGFRIRPTKPVNTGLK